MSADSKKSSTPSKLTKNGPMSKAKSVKRGAFSPPIWKLARKTAAEYQIILGSEDGEWFGRGLELPNVFGDGSTAEACVDSTREALSVAVA